MQNQKSNSASTLASTSTMAPQRGEWSNTKSNNDPSKPSQLMRMFESELKDIFWTEKALSKAIPIMIKNAASINLIEVLTMHLEDSHEQVIRLRKVFASIGKKPVSKKSKAIEAMIIEGESIMESCKSAAICDAGIVLVRQKVGYYEITTYGTLCVIARILGEIDAAALLQRTFDEKKAADDNLFAITQSINMEAEEEAYLLN